MVHCVYVFAIYVHFRLLRKHSKCDVIVNRCLRLKINIFSITIFCTVEHPFNGGNCLVF